LRQLAEFHTSLKRKRRKFSAILRLRFRLVCAAIDFAVLLEIMPVRLTRISWRF
jgi:hypothetical protein